MHSERILLFEPETSKLRKVRTGEALRGGTPPHRLGWPRGAACTRRGRYQAAPPLAWRPQHAGLLLAAGPCGLQPAPVPSPRRSVRSSAVSALRCTSQAGVGAYGNALVAVRRRLNNVLGDTDKLAAIDVRGPGWAGLGLMGPCDTRGAQQPGNMARRGCAWRGRAGEGGLGSEVERRSGERQGHASAEGCAPC